MTMDNTILELANPPSWLIWGMVGVCIFVLAVTVVPIWHIVGSPNSGYSVAITLIAVLVSLTLLAWGAYAMYSSSAHIIDGTKLVVNSRFGSFECTIDSVERNAKLPASDVRLRTFGIGLGPVAVGKFKSVSGDDVFSHVYRSNAEITKLVCTKPKKIVYLETKPEQS